MQTSGTNLVQQPLPTLELRGRRNLLGAAALTAALTLACSASWAQTAATAPVKGGAANLAMVGEPQGLDPMVSTADLVGTIMQHVY